MSLTKLGTRVGKKLWNLYEYDLSSDISSESTHIWPPGAVILTYKGGSYVDRPSGCNQTHTAKSSATEPRDFSINTCVNKHTQRRSRPGSPGVHVWCVRSARTPRRFDAVQQRGPAQNNPACVYLCTEGGNMARGKERGGKFQIYRHLMGPQAQL